MALTKEHAFGDGPVYCRPADWGFKRRIRALLPTTPEGRAAAAWRQFEVAAMVPKSTRLGPSAWCVNGLSNPFLIQLGEHVVCRGLLRVESFGHGAIRLGNSVYVGDDCLLSAAAGIEVGDRVLLAHGVHVIDNNSHPLDAATRAADYIAILRGKPRPAIESAVVKINSDAWIGFGAIILKGVTIGEGAVIAAGSVVTADVPAHVVAAGNPARVVKIIRDAIF